MFNVLAETVVRFILAEFSLFSTSLASLLFLAGGNKGAVPRSELPALEVSRAVSDTSIRT